MSDYPPSPHGGHPTGQAFFHIEGAIPFDARCYVERPADEQLRRHIERGELCYLLTASQMGKTSLIFRAKAALDEQGIPSAYIDLHGFGTGPDVTMERWCRSFLRALARQLKLDVQLNEWWAANEAFTPIDSLLTFMREVVYTQTGGRGAIFIDEIGTALSLSFGDAFLSGVRSLYQWGDTTSPRPAMVLIGMIPADRLIRDRQTTRFNIGAQIPLGVLGYDDAGVLLEGLPVRDEAILRRVFYWTNGHPYLTQRICRAIAQSGDDDDGGGAISTPADVDALVRRLLLAEGAVDIDSNLSYVRDALVESPRKEELLPLYRDVLRGRRVMNVEHSPLHQELRFCGLVRADEGRLVVANPIYRHVFDGRWVRDNSPFQWWRAVPRYAWAGVGLIVLLAALLGGALFRAVISEREAEQQRNVAFSRRLITESSTLLDSRYDLALLLALQAYTVQQTPETEAALRYGLTANPYLSAFLRAHDAPTAAVAFAPGGARFASADESGRIVVWDTAARAPLPLDAAAPGRVGALAFGADPSLLVSGGCATGAGATATGSAAPADECSAGALAVWRLGDTAERVAYFADEPSAEPTAHDNQITRVALSPDGRYVASAGGSSLVVRALPGGEIVQRVDRPDGLVTAAAFSPTAPGLLAFGDGAGQVSLIDLAGSAPAPAIGAHRERVSDVAFSPDGRLLATAAHDGLIAVWDTATWESAGAPFHADADAVYDIEFDAAGRLLTTGADGRLKRWNLAGLATGDAALELSMGGQGETVTHFAAADTPEGPLLVSTGGGDSVVVWRLDGDPARGRRLAATDAAAYGVLGLDFSPDGSVLAAAGEDGAIRLWDTRRGTLIGPSPQADELAFAHEGGARRAAFSPDGRTLASVGRDRRVLLWELGGPDGNPAAAPVVLGQHAAIPRDVAFSPDGRLLASADDAGLIRLWPLGDTAPTAPASLIAHAAEIFDIDFSPDGRLLASAAWDGTVRFWDTATWQPVGEPVQTGLGEIWDVAFSPDGTLLAVAGSGAAVQLINVVGRETTGAGQETGADPTTAGTLLTNQTTRINALAFSPDGRLLATGSADASVAVWDMATRRSAGRLLNTHREGIYALAFSPDGRLLASSDLGGVVFLSAMTFDDPAAMVCGVAARSLMPDEWAQYVGATADDDPDGGPDGGCPIPESSDEKATTR